jgi:hypothetical protein
MVHIVMILVGQQYHGREIRTGFPRHPEHASRHQDSLNNVLVEIWFSNSIKQNYTQEQRDQISALVAAIKIPLR